PGRAPGPHAPHTRTCSPSGGLSARLPVQGSLPPCLRTLRTQTGAFFRRARPCGGLFSLRKRRGEMTSGTGLLDVRGLKTYFPVVGGVLRKTLGHVKAVNDVSFSMGKGEVVSVVGESGCGKSTLGFSILGLTLPTEGSLKLAGHEL